MVTVILHNAASLPRTDRSIAFAMWRQCATPSDKWALGPHESALIRLTIGSAVLRSSPVCPTLGRHGTCYICSSAFCTAKNSVVTGEPRDFKFGTLTYHSKSYPADEKYSLKGVWSGSGEPFLPRDAMHPRY